MSVELANENETLGQVASTSGYSDLISAVDGSKEQVVSLSAFLKRGHTDAIESCIADLGKVAKESGTSVDVASTAKNLAKMMGGETFVIITDGTSSEE